MGSRMQPLDRTLRSQLERSVRQARPVTEQAARAALDALGVADTSVPPHLDEEQRVLRRRLRAHARSLGDTFRNGGSVPERLIAEVAYEHWHRMLFARFLAENDLLIYDGVAITLEECAELAAEEGSGSGWALAARLAAKLLPQVFRIDSPVFALRLAPDDQRALESLLAGLAPEVFQASDSLGWVYQFWQADAKDRINQSEVKIGARELPAVTQLFTEPYMVSFLLDNALGAWWAAQRLTEADLRSASSEDELRRKAAIPGAPLEYLRFVRVPSPDPDKGEIWTPAAGRFEAWPEQLSELKVLDPCCGSGHFLVAVLLMLTPMRMELEELSASEAIDAVLRENLHGLEIDQRCVELAAFALALTAWRYPGAGGYRALPELHLACSGRPVTATKDEWKRLGLGRQNLSVALDWMHDAFHDAPVLGSLINPTKFLATKIIPWEELSRSLNQALQQEQTPEGQETAVVAQGLTKAATLLVEKFDLVITNVPYLKGGYHSPTLKTFLEEYYPRSKYDLAAVFVERSFDFLRRGGTSAIVTQQYWLFLKYYEKLREKLLRETQLGLIARLGPGSFETISGEVVNVCLQIVHNIMPSAGYIHRGFEVSHVKRLSDKIAHIRGSDVLATIQHKNLTNPDMRISFELGSEENSRLSELADFGKGSVSGDGAHYLRKFWELNSISEGLKYWLNSPNTKELWSGRSDCILWGEGGHNPEIEIGFAHRGQRVFGKNGIAIGKAGSLRFTPYVGEIFDDNVAVISPYRKEMLDSIWGFCVSGKLDAEIRKLDKKMSVTAGTFTKVPFDLHAWEHCAYGASIREAASNDLAQWIFHGHPCGSVNVDGVGNWTTHGPLGTDETVLHVAVARLLGYRWPAELDPAMQLAEEQRKWVRRSEALLRLSDTDGIVSIPPVRGEARAEERLLNLLAAAYGDAWGAETLSRLLASSDHSGKSLESWLRDKFFAQHCKLFQQRPFIWQIWDGLRDGFSVLVNYHKLDRKNLETLIYTYLGDWIRSQRDDFARGVDGAHEKLDAAEALQRRLEQILEGEAPYDIFVRWKPIEEQPIGWNPDLNDGVRLNIRPFLTVDDVGRKGAGILRDKPNIHWKRDRGKDVASAPWFHRFKGERINDHHLTLADKKASREQHENHNKP